MLLKLPAFILSLNIRRFWLHAVFWGLIIGTMFYVIYIENGGKGTSPIPFFCSCVVILSSVYTSFYLYDRYLAHQKYFLFTITMIGGFVVTAFLNTIISWIFDRPEKGDDFGSSLIVMLVFNVIGFSARFMHQGFLHTLKVQQLRTEQMEGELKHLRSQVNPHFLFNTLNNLYATNLEDPEKANEMILQLADLMRYQLHSAQQPQVNLAEEVDMLENYIALEKIRIHNVTVTVEKQGDFREVAVAPLLLLPLVENAFKHGTGIEAGRIHFQFILTELTFEFACVNTVPATKRKVHSGQVGLENVRKRLGLLYAGRHNFTARKTGEEFVTSVKISL